MTAPAAAPAPAPIMPLPPRASPQPPADAHAFAAVLDSLPGGAVKADASTVEEAPRPSNEKRLDQPPGQKPGHSPLSDGSLLASLPLALQAAPIIDEGLDHAPSLRLPATRGPEPEGAGASVAVSARTAALARMIGERAFHLGVSTAVGAPAGRALAIDSPFAPAGSSTAIASVAPAANPGGGPALAAGSPAAEAAPIAPRPGKAAANRVSPIRPASEAARSGPRPEAAARPSVERIATSAATRPPAESGGDGKAPGGRAPDPAAPAAPSLAQAGPFGAPLSAPFGAAAPFAPDGSAAGAANIAPGASAPAPGPASTAPPVKEIDVDLSPGGLEDVSMTMRLAGDKLSVVVRAASSQTLSSIEGARDAIADRLAAIGQPLDSLIIQQTGVKADGTNGNPASADDGPAGDQWRPAQGAGERGSPNDALSRRGAHRDRGF